jgi:hypothetical protein
VAVKFCFLGEATYHLKKTKPLSEAPKEALCIVKIEASSYCRWAVRGKIY